MDIKSWTRNRLISFAGHRSTEGYMVCYPKAGSTWIRVMLGRYVQLVEGAPEDSPLPMFSSFDAVGLCRRAAPWMPRLQFTHSPLEWDGQTGGDLTRDIVIDPYIGKSIVLMTRNVPDLLVSHFWQQKTRKSPGYPGEASDFIREPVFGVDKALAFHKVWAEERGAIDRLMLLRYEDIRREPAVWFAKLLEFWGIPVHEEQMLKAVEFSDFDNMRKMELKNREKPVIVYESTKLSVFATGDVGKTPEAFHVRKGSIGGYREYLGESDIEFLRQKMAGAFPDWYGYPDGFEPDARAPEGG